MDASSMHESTEYHHWGRVVGICSSIGLPPMCQEWASIYGVAPLDWVRNNIISLWEAGDMRSLKDTHDFVTAHCTLLQHRGCRVPRRDTLGCSFPRFLCFRPLPRIRCKRCHALGWNASRQSLFLTGVVGRREGERDGGEWGREGERGREGGRCRERERERGRDVDISQMLRPRLESNHHMCKHNEIRACQIASQSHCQVQTVACASLTCPCIYQSRSP